MRDHDDRHPDGRPEPAGGNDYVTTFDPETDAASDAVVRATAAFSGTDPLELPVLAEFVDPDALCDICRPRPEDRGAGTERLQFDYGAYVVSVRSTGRIRLRRRRAAGS